MCTVSWITEGEAFRLWFNRDEQKTRTQAEGPQVWEGEDGARQFLGPRDPDGGGTWLGVNEDGVLVALLNYYEAAKTMPLGRKSRGGLVVQLLGAGGAGKVAECLDSMDLRDYSAFHLLILGGGKESLSTWDGKALRAERVARRFWTTSSVETERVKAARLRIYERMIGDKDVIGRHRALHRTYAKEDGAGSICMRREDAETVSHLEVVVDGKMVRMDYGERWGEAEFGPMERVQMERQ